MCVGAFPDTHLAEFFGDSAVHKLRHALDDPAVNRHSLPLRAAALALCAATLAPLPALSAEAGRPAAAGNGGQRAPVAAAPARDAAQQLAARVDRLTWGATPAELARAQEMGFPAWLDAQLRPAAQPALPAPIADEIAALSISQTDARKAVLAQRARGEEIKQIQDPKDKLQARRDNRDFGRDRVEETQARAIWLALYSPNQLQEQLTWFWMNHFSVYAGKANVGTVLADYEDRTIRQHALGKFRDLLRATAMSPAMLIYLDNIRNTEGGINENYARELLELHTLGVNGGYSQKDVQELARILTGVGLNQTDAPLKVKPELRDQVVEQGLFAFNPQRHDRGDKTLLGQSIKGGGWDEVERALDMLARHPATARHVSTKLAVYFVSDTPPEALIDAMVQTWQRTDGDIAQVLRTMIAAPAFAQSLDQGKFKDPTHYMYSALRLAYAGREPIRNPDAVANWLKRMGQPLFQRLTPDGWPMMQSDWSGSGQMTTRFEAARAIAAVPATFHQRKGEPKPEIAPLPRLADAYGAGGAGPYARWSAASRQAITDTRNLRDANTYVLAAPEFMRR